MRRIVLFHSSLGAGGAERVLANMASYWSARGISVSLVTTAATGSDFYETDPLVTRVGLDLLLPAASPVDAIENNIRRIARLRDEFQRADPDAVISFSDRNNVLAVIAATGTHIPVIVSERNDPEHLPLGAAWKLLRRCAYRNAAAVVVQTERVAAWARRVVPASKVCIIPNPVPKPSGPRPGPAGFKTIVAVGRLEHQKGFDLLVEAFARCAREHPEWRLVIAGEGSQRSLLEGLVAAKSLEGRVSLPGRLRDIPALFGQAGLFVLPSRFEGFPNALLEAMSFGLPAIAFDCPSGPSEIIRDGVDGVLVPAGDWELLSAAMSTLIRDVKSRRELGSAATQVAERFSVDVIMTQWRELVERVVSGGLRRRAVPVVGA